MKRIIVSLLLAILASHILFFNPLQKLIGDGGDNYEFFGFQYLVKENITHFKLPLAHTDILRYPVGFDLAHGYDGVIPVFTGALLGITMPQPLAYNLTVVFILFLNIFFSFLFFRKFHYLIHKRENFPLECIATLVFALSPYVFARINAHLNLAFVAGFPLLAWSVTRLWEKYTTGTHLKLPDFLYIAFGILMIAFGSLQYLILLGYFAVIGSLILLLTQPLLLKNLVKTSLTIFQNNVQLVLIAASTGIVVFLLFFGDYVINIIHGTLAWIDKVSEYKSCCQPDLLDMVIPNAYLGKIWATINHSATSIEKVVTIGIVEIVLFVAVWLRFIKSRWTLSFSAFFVVSIIIIGLIINLPLIPEAGRIIVLTSFLFATLLIVHPISTNKFIVGAILVLLIAERSAFTVYTSPLFSQEAAKIISAQEGTAVLDVPSSEFDPYISGLPYFYNKKIVDGYFHYTANDLASKLFLHDNRLFRFTCADGAKTNIGQLNDLEFQQTLSLLKENNIRTIVLHKNSKFLFNECQNVRDWWYNFNPPTISLVEGSKQLQIYHGILDARSNLKARFFFEKDGEFQIAGSLIYPLKIANIKITSSEGYEIPFTWKKTTQGWQADLEEPVSYQVKQGESITFFSDTLIQEPIYFTVWYVFYPAPGIQTAQPPLEKMYEDESIEIYQIH